VNINSNTSNLNQLSKAISGVKSGEICIASGWIRSHTLKEVLGGAEKAIRSGKISLRLILRAGDPVDLKITDSYVFSYLEDLKADALKRGGSVELRYSAKHHAKLYVAGEKAAMIGSYNLTGGGFGTEDRPGSNPEAGVFFDDPQGIADVQARFDELWESSLPVNESLAGFVANAASNREFFVYATRPLAAGTFVQYDEGDDVILCKVEESLRYHADYPLIAEGALPEPELFQTLTFSDVKTNALQGIAFSGDARDHQLHIARVKGINRISKQGERYVFGPVNLPPRVGAGVNLADKALLEGFFNPAAKLYAALEENADIAVSLDTRSVLSKHMAVLGSTGSGKSYFVKQFLARHLVPVIQEEQLRIVVIDTHGEYGGAQSDAKDLAFTDIISEEEHLEQASAQLISDYEDVKAIIGAGSREEKNAITRAFSEFQKQAEGTNEDMLKILRSERERLAGDTETEVSWESILQNFLDNEANLEKHAVVKKYKERMDAAATVTDRASQDYLHSQAKRMAVEAIQKEYNYKAPDKFPILDALINRLAQGSARVSNLKLIEAIQKPGLYRLNLTAIDEADVRQAIVGDLMREVFIRAKQGVKQGKNRSFNTLFVVDEAQNYAPQGGAAALPSKAAMKLIASEGRKFNVALLVMTQRPAYLSKDVLSQCNTQAIFRLINNQDIKAIEELVEGISKYDVMQLPTFVPGQAIFTGVGVEMPVRVRVRSS
jgi:hypothetical protein